MKFMMLLKKAILLLVCIQNIYAAVPAWQLIENANSKVFLKSDSSKIEKIFEFDIKRHPIKLTNSNKNQLDAAVNYKERLWPGAIIPYTFGENLAHMESAQKTIQQAITAWETATCIRFIKKTNEDDFVEFAIGIGCNSDVGRIGGKQIVSLGDGCMFKSVIIHEIGHVIGFWHEQNRPDRDDYVAIKTENIKDGMYKEAFIKFSHHQINSLKVEYDYYSIMHYGMKAFSKNNFPTILPKINGVYRLGNDRLSQLDIKQTLLLYKCEEGENMTWTPWSSWTNCDKSCDGGTQERTRVCKSLKNGKQHCSGSRIEKKVCNLQECPSWPIFPDEFSFGRLNARGDNQFDCVIVYERADYQAWGSYSFCNKGLRSLDMRWSDQGSISGMKCTQIFEPQEDHQKRWYDNFLCVPNFAPYNFTWSYEGPIKNLPCLRWFAKDGKDGWDNNFLCMKGDSEIIETPKVHGAWSNWSSWSICSKSCGSGLKRRLRLCNNPAPNYGGTPCEGKSFEDETCNGLLCTACGGVFVGNKGVFNSPSFPSNYPSSTNCVWVIEGTKQKQIVLTIEAFDLEKYLDKHCKFDYLEIRDDGPEGNLRGIFCGSEIPPPITSVSSKLWVRMSTDSDVNKSGFRASWELQKSVHLNCGGAMEGLQGTLTSPNFPRMYPPDKNCVWKIEAPDGYFINMKFIRFDLEYHPSCKYDYLELYDGWDLTSNQIGLFCGLDAVKGTLVTRTNKAWIRFVSSPSNEKSGFKLSWRAYEKKKFFPPIQACPSGWAYFSDKQGGACYILIRNYFSWHDAHKDCLSNTAYLVSVTTKEEHNFLMNKLLDQNFVWLGMTDEKTEGDWVWSDSSAISFVNWDGDEPNDGGYFKNEDCSVMKPDGKWNDYPCSDHFNYICKKKQFF